MTGMHRMLGGIAMVAMFVAGADPAAAHTDPDVVAAPAGQEAQITLQPTHGCGDSPTVEMATRIPVSGAQAVEVPGWSAQVTADGDATVIEWTGGVLPADEVGAFPVRFTTPDRPGGLLTFPFVQVCEDGTELAWIDGDPEGEFPAPRVLILPAGYEAATRIEDVPADAPGRDQLAEVADVDNPVATTTTSVAPTSTTPPETTTAAPTDPSDTEASDSGSGVLPIVLAVGGAALVIGLVAFVVRRRR